ncbi:MAG: phosphate/phosphite/phosphonate ABC transporter substrate-binding protein [Halocynthiibacter sp.]
MIAQLGMYLRDETRPVYHTLWAHTQRHLGFGPVALTYTDAFWTIWQSPDLLLSQTCSYPYRHSLHKHTHLIGSSDHQIDGIPAGYYASVFVVRGTDTRHDLAAFKDATFAYNEALSQSGWAAPQTHAKARGFQFENLLETGGHQRSAQCVADGRADIAALDIVTWTLCQRHDAFARDLKVLDTTEASPALPFITAQESHIPALKSALLAAIDDLSADEKSAILLHGIVTLPKTTYLDLTFPLGPPSI